MTEERKKRPCPACGADFLWIAQDEDAQVLSVYDFVIVCDDCGWIGPESDRFKVLLDWLYSEEEDSDNLGRWFDEGGAHTSNVD